MKWPFQMVIDGARKWILFLLDANPLRLHLLQSNWPGPLYLPKLMVLSSVPVFTGYIVGIFFFFIRRKKYWESITRVCSVSVPFFFFSITILSILLPIFSDFFLSSKDFLLIYSTLKFHVPPSNNVPFSSQSLSSQLLTLLPPHLSSHDFYPFP